jgi:hypothetical protein
VSRTCEHAANSGQDFCCGGTAHNKQLIVSRSYVHLRKSETAVQICYR